MDLLPNISLPGVAGYPTLDLSDFGLSMAATLQPAAPVTALFDPTDASLTIQTSPFFVAMDRQRNKAQWSSEANANSAAIVSDASALNIPMLNCPAATGARASKFSQHRSYAVMGAVLITAATLAGSGTRAIYTKTNGANYCTLSVGASNHVNVGSQGASAAAGGDTGVVATAGRHVYCITFDSVSGLLEVFWDCATTPVFSTTIASAAQLSERWALGCVDPTQGSLLGRIGHTYFMDNAVLHGTPALDRARGKALRDMADYYGVTLAN